MSDKFDDGRDSPAPVGRPTLYLPEYCQLLIDHMSVGHSFASFAAIVDASTQTIYDWCKQHTEFLEAKKKATAKCRLYWEKMGNENAISTTIVERDGNTSRSEQRQLNTGVWIFNMRNRFRWHDKQAEYPEINREDDEQIVTSNGGPAEQLVPAMTKEMALKLLNEKKAK